MYQNNSPKLLTVKQFSSKHQAFTVGSLRWLIFNSGNPSNGHTTNPENGFEKVIIRVGRRVLIDEQAFFDWIESQRNI